MTEMMGIPEVDLVIHSYPVRARTVRFSSDEKPRSRGEDEW